MCVCSGVDYRLLSTPATPASLSRFSSSLIILQCSPDASSLCYYYDDDDITLRLPPPILHPSRISWSFANVIVILLWSQGFLNCSPSSTSPPKPHSNTNSRWMDIVQLKEISSVVHHHLHTMLATRSFLRPSSFLHLFSCNAIILFGCALISLSDEDGFYCYNILLLLLSADGSWKVTQPVTNRDTTERQTDSVSAWEVCKWAFKSE